MNSGILDAIDLALHGHAGQVDKAGKPYIYHLLRVMMRFEDETHQMVGVLHDIVEDTGVTLAYFEFCSWPEEIAVALDHLTRRKAEDYDEFIERCAQNDLARAVKIADLKDHLEGPTASCISDKLRQRYIDALTFLLSINYEDHRTG